MKEPIEELFKQSLQGHEMPYNPDAWKAMSARLDAVSPVVKPNSNIKYYIGVAGIGAVAIASYFIFAGGDTNENVKEPVAQETTLEQTHTRSTKPSSGNSDAQNSNTSVISNSNETSNSPDKGLKGSSATASNSDIKPNTGTKANHEGQTPHIIVGGTPDDIVHQQNDQSTLKTKPITGYSNTVAQKMTMPTVADLCLNEETTITNPNDREIYILNSVGAVIQTIPANKSIVFKPSKVGNYSLGYKNDQTIQSTSNFVVNRIPDAEFTIDLVNKYENGLPSTHVEAISGQGTYVWKAKGQSVKGDEADLRFYNKGEQTITLTVDNGQCASTVEKTIFVEDDYNLMAVKGFTPTSTIPENQTFMPFALTQRADLKFVMTIFDSRDGGKVYETTDASLPWDGVDIRSGRRSENTPQVFVWKVVILNPAKNEPSEYRGTVTMN